MTPPVVGPNGELLMSPQDHHHYDDYYGCN